MRAVRDSVIMVCAIVSTLCLVYIAANIESARSVVSRIATPNAEADAILERLRRPAPK